MALLAAAFATEQQQCQDSAPQVTTQGNSLLQARTKIEKDDMEEEMDEEQDIDEALADVEETAHGQTRWATSCPRLCGWRRVKAKSWDVKCWMWACFQCPDWQEKCKDVDRGNRPQLCGKWCERRLRRVMGRSRMKTLMCSWPRCQLCEGWENKCAQEPPASTTMGMVTDAATTSMPYGPGTVPDSSTGGMVTDAATTSMPYGPGTVPDSSTGGMVTDAATTSMPYGPGTVPDSSTGGMVTDAATTSMPYGPGTVPDTVTDGMVTDAATTSMPFGPGTVPDTVTDGMVTDAATTSMPFGPGTVPDTVTDGMVTDAATTSMPFW